MALIETHYCAKCDTVNKTFLCPRCDAGQTLKIVGIDKAMAQDLTGGYCPKCNTVWASPGVCKCRIDKQYILKSTGQNLGKLKSSHDADSLLCFMINGEERCFLEKDIEIKIIGEVSVFEIEIWNKAIEAAALKIEGAPLFANEIRKLKR